MSCFFSPNNFYGTERPNNTLTAPSGFQMQPATGMQPVTTLPTGFPTGPSLGGPSLATALQSQTPAIQTPQTVQNPYYTAGYLREHINRDVRVEFMIGTGGPLIDRIGTLVEVGASYIVLRPFRTNDLLMCDLYSIRFVTIYG
jgi:hypothetical protein